MDCRNKGFIGRKVWNNGLVGDPRSGKPWLGKKRTEVIKKMAAVNRTLIGEKNPHWKGESASYAAKHMWARACFKKSGVCEICNETRKTQWASNSKTEFKRTRDGWRELCSSCHKYTDLGKKRLLKTLFIWE